MILAFAFLATISADHAARPFERSYLVEIGRLSASANAAQGVPAAASAAGTADPSSPDPELRRVQSILQRMQQDPAAREKLYEDVDSLVRAVRNGQPIPSQLRVDYALPVPDHNQEPSYLANVHPATAILLPVRGTPVPTLQPALPRSGPEPVSPKASKLFSPTGTPLDPAVVKRLIYWAQANGCPIELALATAWRESEMTLHPPRGSSGEIGMMQIMPERARLEGVDPSRLEDPETNMWLGTKLLARYYQQERSVARAAMMYVAGPNVFAKTYGPDLRNYIAHYSASVDNFATYFGTYLNF